MYPCIRELEAILGSCADEEILPRFGVGYAWRKSDGSLVTEADIAMQARVQRELHQRWPQFTLLGEEMAFDVQRRLLDRPGDGIWCLDPIDGTVNFASGIPHFGVSLALIDGEGPVIGIVLDPIRRECFSALRGKGAGLDGDPVYRSRLPTGLNRCIAGVEPKRLTPGLSARLAAERPFLVQRQFGSAALDWCWLAAGRLHVYLHGGQHLWDYAAGQVILSEAGGSATTLAGGRVYASALGRRSIVAASSESLLHELCMWVNADESDPSMVQRK